MTSVVVLRFARTPPPWCHCVRRILFLLFWERRWNRQSSSRSYLQLRRPRPARRPTKHKTGSEGGGTVSAVDCEGSRQKHHSLARSLSMFETRAQKTDRRHPTSFPNTNEVECMPATNLHDLLCTTADSMHNTCTLNQLQIAAGRACDVNYSLIRVSSS